MSRQKVLITGGAGAIGTGFAEHRRGSLDLTLVDLPGRFSEEHGGLGATVEADLSDLTAIAPLFEGVDAVIHLAGDRRPGAQWETLLPANIIGTYNVVTAAVAAGCRRLVYASSVHTVTGYPDGEMVRESDPVRPGDLYGVTKCFGEALGAYAADQEGLAVTALRIGAFKPAAALQAADAGWMMRDYCLPDDLYRILDAILQRADGGFEIINVVSDNAMRRLSLARAHQRYPGALTADAFAEVPAFTTAFAAVGGLEDPEIPSGLRDDLAVLRERASLGDG